MRLGARGARQGSVPVACGTGSGSRSPSPTTRRRVWARGRQRRSVPRHASRPRARPSPGRPPLTSAARGPTSASPAAVASPPAPPPPSCVSTHPSAVTSGPAPDAPPPRRRSAAVGRSLPVLGAEAGERGSERRPSGGRRGGRVGPRPGRSRGHGAAAAGLGRAGAAGPTAMAGYARRPGVTPLSRARSLVIPDGERRAAGRAGPGGGREGEPGVPRPEPAAADGGGAPSPVQVGTGPGPRRSCPGPGERPRRAPPARGEVAVIVIPAPACYERRSCLPQLDCGRSRGRDLDSHFFGIRPTFMCYVPSPVLASVGDTGERRA